MDALGAGTVLGNYRIERLIGSGQTGQVYAATHVALQKRVALKVLAAGLVKEPTIVQRFLREGRAAARVRHDNIIEVFDVGVADDRPYLAMELLEGESLAQRFDRGPMPAEELAAIMLPVLAAVATAHEAGIVHRDLKPENLFLRRDARRQIQPVVLDFGLSKILDERHLDLTDTNALIGTPHYMSPEQVRGAKNVTDATDQYALGVMMYEAVVGRSPFDDETALDALRAITSGRYRAPREANPAVPKGLARVISRAMSHEIEARYPDLWALGRELLPLAGARDRETWQAVFSRLRPGRFKMTSDGAAGRGRWRSAPGVVVLIGAGVVALLVAGLLARAWLLPR